jgi:hypothetical protein
VASAEVAETYSMFEVGSTTSCTIWQPSSNMVEDNRKNKELIDFMLDFPLMLY